MFFLARLKAQPNLSSITSLLESAETKEISGPKEGTKQHVQINDDDGVQEPVVEEDEPDDDLDGDYIEDYYNEEFDPFEDAGEVED